MNLEIISSGTPSLPSQQLLTYSVQFLNHESTPKKSTLRTLIAIEFSMGALAVSLWPRHDERLTAFCS